MADKFPWIAYESGTYTTGGSPDPKVDLSGTVADLGASYPARTFAQAAGDASTTFDDGDVCQVIVAKDKDTWAIYQGATWNDAGTDYIDLNAGTLVASEGSLSNTDSVTVYAQYPEHSGLPQSAQTVTTTDVTGAVNTHYLCTIAGLTANRNLTLPTATPGDRIRVTVLDGDATYELIIKGAATVTINGGSAATEWSRLMIADESVTMEATSATNWQVIQDGRIAQYCKIYLSTQCDGEPANTWTEPTSASSAGAWTTTHDNASMASLSNGRIYARRAGGYNVTVSGAAKDVTGSNIYNCAAMDDSGNWISFARIDASSVAYITCTATVVHEMTSSDDFVRFSYMNTQGNSGCSYGLTVYYPTWLLVTEII